MSEYCWIWIGVAKIGTGKISAWVINSGYWLNQEKNWQNFVKLGPQIGKHSKLKKRENLGELKGFATPVWIVEKLYNCKHVFLVRIDNSLNLTITQGTLEHHLFCSIKSKCRIVFNLTIVEEILLCLHGSLQSKPLFLYLNLNFKTQFLDSATMIL